MDAYQVYISSQIEHLRILVQSSSLTDEIKTLLLDKINLLQIETISSLFMTLDKPISATNMRYVLCFLLNIDVPIISTLFNVDVRSVYSVRYRLRKMFVKNIADGNVLPF